MKLTVLRPFLVNGQRQEIGSEFETDDRVFAASLVHEGKVERIAEVERSGPMTTETMPAVVSGKASRKGGKEKADNHE